MNIDLVKRWVALKEEEAAAKRKHSELVTEREAVEHLVIEDLVDDGVSSVAVDGQTVYINNPVRAKKASEDVTREQIVEALEACGHGDIAPRSFNWNTLTALCRELMEDGAPLPAALTAVLEVQTVQTLGKRNK